jgi:transposase
MLPAFFPLRRSRPHAWRPMTDAEWADLAPLIQSEGAGRPPQNRRRTMDAIFWVACSAGPWHALPPNLGNWNSTHRALTRLARSGTLDRLLVAVSRHPLAAQRMGSLEWRIVRAWRRACRLIGLGSLDLARRLGLWSALPCGLNHLPYPEHEGLLLRAARDIVPKDGPPKLAKIGWLMRLHRLVGGNPARFRTTEPAW